MSPPSESPRSEQPLIGLTTYEEQARYLVWDHRAVLLPSGYPQAVAAAGGIPVLLPPLPSVAEAVLSRLDGLVLTGGPDVDPRRYGAVPLQTTSPPREARDEAELALFAAATTAGVPVLGVCRGLQLMNVARGGTLVQHLPDKLGAGRAGGAHSPAPAVYGHHPVAVVPGSLLAEALGRTEAEVASYHHQAVDELGKGLTVSATAPDGTVEAIEDQSAAFCLAVQWHPEVRSDNLFAALVAAARRGRSERDEGA
jgi:gamma-glutamyl-gamma-aminobutyrate hydrolase PuuD